MCPVSSQVHTTGVKYICWIAKARNLGMSLRGKCSRFDQHMFVRQVHGHRESEQISYSLSAFWAAYVKYPTHLLWNVPRRWWPAFSITYEGLHM